MAIGGIWDEIWDAGIWDTSIWSSIGDPELVNALIALDGDSITLFFNKPVTFGAGGNAGWALTASGGAVTATYSSGGGTAALVYTLSRSVAATETVTIAYTQPGDGVEDLAGNDVASIVSDTVGFFTGSFGPAGTISVFGGLGVRG